MLYLNSISNLLKRDSFAGNTAILMLGTTIAQAIVIICSPILTRLYSPDSFGLFATLLSAISILGVVAGGRYELAILVPTDRRDSFALVILSCLISAVFSSVILIILVIVNMQTEYYLIPFAVFLSSIVTSLSYWHNRNGHFWTIAISRLSASIANAGTSIGVGFFFSGNTLGLIFGILTGNVAAGLVLLRRLQRVTKLPLRFVAKRYERFPRYLIIAHLINVAAQQLPLLLLAPLFGLAAAGFFMLTHRVVSLPIQIVSGAIGEVFRRRASEDIRRTGQCRGIYLQTAGWLTVMSLPTFAMFFWLAPALFAWVFGAEWEEAGVLARVLAPMFAVQFVASPLSSMFMIAEEQKLDLIWQIFALVAVSVSFLLGFILKDYVLTLSLYSASYVAMQVINMAFTYRFASGWKFQDHRG